MSKKNTEVITKDNCLAFREYRITDQPDKKVILLIGHPELYAQGNGEYVGRYRIIGDDIDISYPILGIDPIQALLSTFKMAEEAILNENLNLESPTGEKGLFLLKSYAEGHK